MIATADIACILYRDCKELFGMEAYQDGFVPEGKLEAERVVVHPKEQSADRTWRKSFSEVNILVPQLPDGSANLLRLGELERAAAKGLKGSGWWDGTFYRYEAASTKILKEERMGCWYVNARVLFQSLNTIEQNT